MTLVFLDCETTGLDRGQSEPVEAHARIGRWDARSGLLDVETPGTSWIVDGRHLDWEPKAEEMARESGLWCAMAAVGETEISVIRTKVSAWLDGLEQWMTPYDEPAIICGSNPMFDHAIFPKWLDKTGRDTWGRVIHPYRTLDINSLCYFTGVDKSKFAAPHRAKGDVNRDIELFRACRDRLRA